MTETAFATEILKWAKTYKWRTFHVRNSGFGGQTYVQGDKGWPDLFMVRGKRVVIAELKVGKPGTLKGDPTPEQEAWLAAFRAIEWGNAYVEVYVWRPEQWSEILVVLSAK